jgi:aspartokinase-like uncharacterized kinase
LSRLRIIKLGGSLLSLPNLREKFHRWCCENSHPLTLVMVGGGGMVDAVREVNRSNPLPEEFAHWLCMDLLRHTARLAHQILGDVELVESIDDLQQLILGSTIASTMPNIAIVQVEICFARNLSNLGLPASWQVTSDSLAAALSQMYEAEEVVMMKSTDVPSGYQKLAELADAGIVDRYFPDLASESKVRFVNLRTF